MTVRELIHKLEQEDPDTEVRLILDQFMPMEYEVGHIMTVGPVPLYEDDPHGEDTEPVTYLVTGTQLGYVQTEVRVATETGS